MGPLRKFLKEALRFIYFDFLTGKQSVLFLRLEPDSNCERCYQRLQRTAELLFITQVNLNVLLPSTVQKVSYQVIYFGLNTRCKKYRKYFFLKHLFNTIKPVNAPTNQRASHVGAHCWCQGSDTEPDLTEVQRQSKKATESWFNLSVC